MKSIRSILLLAWFSGLSGATAASPLYQDFVFTGYRYALPEVQATLVGPDQPFGETPSTVNGVGGDYRIGFQAPSMPVLAGREPVLELGLRLNAGDREEREASPTGVFGFMPVDGSGASGDTGGVPVLGYESEVLDTTLDGLVVTTLDVSPRFASRLAWGLSWRRLRVEHGFFGYLSSGARVADIKTEDEIVTDYLSGVMEFRLVRPLSRSFRFWARARGELGLAMADLEVDQELSAAFRASDSDTGFAPAAGVGAGVSWKLANLVLGVQLSADYLGYVATVEHPLHDARPFASRIRDDSMTVIGAGLTAALVF